LEEADLYRKKSNVNLTNAVYMYLTGGYSLPNGIAS
jgi:hypothetical protein